MMNDDTDLVVAERFSAFDAVEPPDTWGRAEALCKPGTHPRRALRAGWLAAAAVVLAMATGAGLVALLIGDRSLVQVETPPAAPGESGEAPGPVDNEARQDTEGTEPGAGGPAVTAEGRNLGALHVTSSPLRPAEGEGWLAHTVTLTNTGEESVHLHDFRTGVLLGDREVLAATEGCGFGSIDGEAVNPGCRGPYRPITIEPGGQHRFTVTLWRSLAGMSPVTGGRYEWQLEMQIGDAPFADPDQLGGQSHLLLGYELPTDEPTSGGDTPATGPTAECEALYGSEPWLVLFQETPPVPCVVVAEDQDVQVWNKGFDETVVEWVDGTRTLASDSFFATGPIGDLLTPGTHNIDGSPYQLPTIHVLAADESPAANRPTDVVETGMTLNEAQRAYGLDLAVDPNLMSGPDCGAAVVPGDPYSPFFIVTAPQTDDAVVVGILTSSGRLLTSDVHPCVGR